MSTKSKEVPCNSKILCKIPRKVLGNPKNSKGSQQIPRNLKRFQEIPKNPAKF